MRRHVLVYLAVSMATKRRKHLTLEDKFKVIKKHKEGRSVQDLKEEYECGQTQIYAILKQKEHILSSYESNASSSSHSLGHIARKSSFSQINDSLYDWYLLACSKSIYPDGPTLKLKAQESLA